MTKNQKLEDKYCKLLCSQRELVRTAVNFMEAGKEYEIICCGSDFHSYVNGILYKISKCRLDSSNTLEFYATSLQVGNLREEWINQFFFGNDIYDIISYINFPD